MRYTEHPFSCSLFYQIRKKVGKKLMENHGINYI